VWAPYQSADPRPMKEPPAPALSPRGSMRQRMWSPVRSAAALKHVAGPAKTEASTARRTSDLPHRVSPASRLGSTSSGSKPPTSEPIQTAASAAVKASAAPAPARCVQQDCTPQQNRSSSTSRASVQAQALESEPCAVRLNAGFGRRRSSVRTGSRAAAFWP
jgi:hypothetical protein